MTFNGIDVSYHNGNIDWAKVKAAGVEFAMIRAAYGKNEYQTDKKLIENVAGCEVNKIPYGFYHYSYAQTIEDAEKEADFFLRTIAPYSPKMPCAYDLEDPSQVHLPPEQIGEMARVFTSKVRAAGYYPMVYANNYWLNSRIDLTKITGVDIWLAQWAAKPTYKGQFGMWQRDNNGSIPGIIGRVDLDTAYIDYPKAIELLKGEPVPDNTPSEYAREAVEKAIEKGILQGDNGDYKLHSPLTRQDFFVLAQRLNLL